MGKLIRKATGLTVGMATLLCRSFGGFAAVSPPVSLRLAAPAIGGCRHGRLGVVQHRPHMQEIPRDFAATGDFYIAISMRSISQTTHFSQPRFSG